MEPVTIIAVVGLITTTAAPFLHRWLDHQRQESLRLRQLRTELYADGCVFAQYWQSVMNHYLDPDSDDSELHLAKPPPADGITARMRLLAEPAVMAAWMELFSAEEFVRLNVYTAPDFRAGKLPDWEDPPAVQRLYMAVEDFYSVARAAQINTSARRKKAIES